MEADDPAVEAFVASMKALSEHPDTPDHVSAVIGDQIATLDRRIPAPRRGEVLEAVAVWPERCACLIWLIAYQTSVPIVELMRIVDLVGNDFKLRTGEDANLESLARTLASRALGIEAR